MSHAFMADILLSDAPRRLRAGAPEILVRLRAASQP
jgi:hypothetical protein